MPLDPSLHDDAVALTRHCVACAKTIPDSDGYLCERCDAHGLDRDSQVRIQFDWPDGKGLDYVIRRAQFKTNDAFGAEVFRIESAGRETSAVTLFTVSVSR